MHIAYKPLRVLCSTAAIAAFAIAASSSLRAQEPGDGSSRNGSLSQASSFSNLIASASPAENLAYSSSAGADETASAESFISSSLAADPAGDPGGQPPPRRYGRRPVYADKSHNADGSSKYTFFGGAGFTLPTGGTHAYFSPSYDFQVGGGRNFNNKFAVLAQFDWHNFGIQTNTLNNLLNTYNNLGAVDENGDALTELDGHAHIWSVTVDPMYTYMQRDKIGGYVIGGAGFYHKVTDFTTPEVGVYDDPYYGPIEYEANATIDSYVSNAAGFNGGLGFTYKGSRFSDIKFYAEARYVYTLNSARPYYDTTAATNPTSNANYFNVFPQNSAKTTYIPVTFGVRF